MQGAYMGRARPLESGPEPRTCMQTVLLRTKAKLIFINKGARWIKYIKCKELCRSVRRVVTFLEPGPGALSPGPFSSRGFRLEVPDLEKSTHAPQAYRLEFGAHVLFAAV
jgi:hypothetical protein